jgi:hypothetical protein
MKKMIALLLVLAMALGIGCAFAENAALPAFTYSGTDPVWVAVENYMLATDFGYTPEEGGVLIPTPIILKTDMNAEETEATVYGNFWIFCYKQNGKILETTSVIPTLDTKQADITLSGRTLHIQGVHVANVTVYSLTGQVMMQTTTTDGTVQLPQLPSAVYAVQVNAEGRSLGSTLIRL